MIMGTAVCQLWIKGGAMNVYVQKMDLYINQMIVCVFVTILKKLVIFYRKFHRMKKRFSRIFLNSYSRSYVVKIAMLWPTKSKFFGPNDAIFSCSKVPFT